MFKLRLDDDEANFVLSALTNFHGNKSLVRRFRCFKNTECLKNDFMPLSQEDLESLRDCLCEEIYATEQREFAKLVKEIDRMLLLKDAAENSQEEDEKGEK